jgi:hypothetical protein
VARVVREIAEELFTILEEGGVRLAQDHPQAARLAAAWHERAKRTTRALLLLHDHGFDREAAPMRRSLIEHALALQWIGRSPDAAYDAHVKAHENLVVKFAAKPESAGTVAPETLEALRDMELVGGPESYLLNVYELAKRYGPEGTYIGWFFETGGSHPSWRSGEAYRQGRSGQSSTDEVMPILWLLLASGGFSKLLDRDPWASTVQRLDAELAQPAAEALAEERRRRSQ